MDESERHDDDARAGAGSADFPPRQDGPPSDPSAPTHDGVGDLGQEPAPLLHRRDQWTLAAVAALALVWLAWDWAGSTRWGMDTLDVERDPARRLDYRIDINSANWVQWRNLTGVGEVLARRIVAHRQAHGPFGAVEDLARVRGIGPALVERLRPYVSVGDQAAGADRHP